MKRVLGIACRVKTNISDTVLFPDVSLSLRKWWARKGRREGKGGKTQAFRVSLLSPSHGPLRFVLVPSFSCFELAYLLLKSKRLRRRQLLTNHFRQRTYSGFLRVVMLPLSQLPTCIQISINELFTTTKVRQTPSNILTLR